MDYFETETMNEIGDMTSYSSPDWGFDLLGDFIFWRAKTDELNRSANILWSAFENDCHRIQVLAKNITQLDSNYDSPPSVLNTFVFLAGLSIENLLKGIILIGNTDYVKDGKLSKSIQTHDLFKLAKLAKITLTKEEEHLSEILGESITSFGRYPIPLDRSKLKEKITIKSYIKEAYDSFYTRLMQETLLRYEKINLEIDKNRP